VTTIITVGTTRHKAPKIIAGMADASPELAALLTAPVAAGDEYETTEIEVGGHMVDVQRGQGMLEICIAVGGSMEIKASFEECEDEADLTLSYVGKDGAMVDRMAEFEDRTLAECIEISDVLKPFGDCTLRHFDQSYDRSDRTYEVDLSIYTAEEVEAEVLQFPAAAPCLGAAGVNVSISSADGFRVVHSEDGKTLVHIPADQLVLGDWDLFWSGIEAVKAAAAARAPRAAAAG